MDASNRQEQREEALALASIYGDDDFSYNEEHHYCEVHLPDSRTVPHVRLTVHLPEGYPSTTPPVVEVHGPHLPDDAKRGVEAALHGSFSPGEVVLFTWIEGLREQQELWQVPSEQPRPPEPPAGGAVDSGDGHQAAASAASVEAAAAAAAAPSTELPAMAEISGRIVHGQPFTERKSTFQAHVAPITSADEVDLVMDSLLQHNKIRSATHNIMAYRIVEDGRDAAIKDYDSDGEDAAGSRLAQLLHNSGAANVVVVVTRWYGGVHLGPSRFAIINNVARQLLEEEGFVGGGGGGGKAPTAAAGKGKAGRTSKRR